MRAACERTKARIERNAEGGEHDESKGRQVEKCTEGHIQGGLLYRSVAGSGSLPGLMAAGRVLRHVRGRPCPPAALALALAARSSWRPPDALVGSAAPTRSTAALCKLQRAMLAAGVDTAAGAAAAASPLAEHDGGAAAAHKRGAQQAQQAGGLVEQG